MATENLYLNDLFQKHLQKAMEHVSREAASYIDGVSQSAFDQRTDWEWARLKCVSPLEAVFYTWWAAAALVRNIGSSHWIPIWLFDEHEVTVDERTYRLDFQVRDLNGGGHFNTTGAALKAGLEHPKIGVELDGHDFHERTKEQVTYRNQRDRDLQRSGWKVFHYSGSELVSKPLACVDEVFDYAHEQYIDLFNRAAEINRAKG